MGRVIDWDLALATGRRLAPAGPALSAAEAAEVVEQVRAHSLAAREPVAAITGLVAPEGAGPTLVIDRPRWIEANLASFRVLLQPLADRLTLKAPGPLARRAGGAVSGAEIGALLALLSSKVLGQFDPYGADGGRLLLVAPNLVEIERRLGVDPDDFRLWVCLHEETHRLQFTGVPWLAEHLRSQTDLIARGSDLDPRVILSGLAELVRVLRGRSDRSLAEIFTDAEQRAVIDRITGVMSLLEGHADVVMDEVGPQVVPSVAHIRERFEARRDASGGGLAGVLRRLLGFEGKLRQYRDGAVFVRAVHDQVGAEGFAAVWADPAHLPGRAEILDPAAWVRRVHG